MQLNLNMTPTGMYGLYTLAVVIDQYDNEAAYLYEASIYELSATAYALGSVAAIGGLIVFIIGIFGGKLIGIEMMAVIQLSYLSLISMESLNPGFNAISRLWYVNGYNELRFDNAYLIEAETKKPKGLTMYPYFVLNYNLTMLLIFGPILIGLIMFVLSRIWKPTLAKYWPLLVG